MLLIASLTTKQLFCIFILGVFNLSTYKFLSLFFSKHNLDQALEEKKFIAVEKPLGNSNGVADEVEGRPADSTRLSVPDVNLARKDPPKSYSRLVGVMGGVVMATFFWAFGNVLIYKVLFEQEKVADLLSNFATYYYAGAALFLPYGVNQLSALMKKSGSE